MKNLLRAGAMALGLLLCAPATSQVGGSGQCEALDTNGNCVHGHALVVGSAVSNGLTEVAGTVTSTSVATTLGSGTFSNGTAYVGPMTPQLGRPVRIVLKGTWVGTVQVGTSTAANGCVAGAINPLTVGGQAYGSYSGNANEAVDEAWLSGIVYCLTAAVTSGTLTYSVRQ